MAASPTQRSLEWARKQDWKAAVSEKWIPQTRQRKDLFGFIDIVCLTGDSILGVQATSRDNQTKRFQKITSECTEDARAWLACGGKIEVWGWGKKKVKRGGKAVRWVLTRREVLLEDLEFGTLILPEEETDDEEDTNAV